MKRPRSSIPWFRFGSVPWGTVYLMQARNRPDLFKVGFTKRKTITRRAEINRIANDDMKIVQTITMPWAYVCEQSVLRRFRSSWFRRGDVRGSEWFKLRRNETMKHVSNRIERVARKTQRLAMWKCSWPKGYVPRVKRF